MLFLTDPEVNIEASDELTDVEAIRAAADNPSDCVDSQTAKECLQEICAWYRDDTSELDEHIEQVFAELQAAYEKEYWEREYGKEFKDMVAREYERLYGHQ